MSMPVKLIQMKLSEKDATSDSFFEKVFENF